MIALEAEHVSKRFRRKTVQTDTTLKTTVVDMLHGRRHPAEAPTIEVLRDVSFAIQRGRRVGIVGRNGSGKSTLLRLLVGIYRPDQGRIVRHGRVGAILELGAGFHPEFSGRENIYVNGVVLGLTRRDVHARLDDIVRFAELEAVIDEPIKTYSLGMYMRLGFSVAVHADPDILLLDEILAVGDESFQQKCLERIAEFHRRGRTVVLVSHDLMAIERWSDEVIWLDAGRVRHQGEPRSVLERYREALASREGVMVGARAGRPAPTSRPGNRAIEITAVELRDDKDAERRVFRGGETARLVLRYRVHRPVSAPVFAVRISRDDGLVCYGTSTGADRVTLGALGDQGVVEVVFESIELLAGAYSVDVSVSGAGGEMHDNHWRAQSFAVRSEADEVGVARMPHHWRVRPADPGAPGAPGSAPQAADGTCAPPAPLC